MHFLNPFNPKLSVEKNYVFEKSSVMMREIMGGSNLPNPPFSHFSTRECTSWAWQLGLVCSSLNNVKPYGPEERSQWLRKWHFAFVVHWQPVKLDCNR